MAQIALLSIKLTKLSFGVNEAFKSTGEGIDLRFEFSLSGAFDEAANRIRVKLGVATGEEFSTRGPFSLEARMEGVFRPDEGIEKELLDQFIRINCPAIIFPYLREVVSALTQRAGFPPLYLPVTNFKKHDRPAGELQSCGTVSTPDGLTPPPKPSRKRKGH